MADRRSTQVPAHTFRFPRLYDGLLRLLWGRAEDHYRTKLLDLAHVSAGDAVLDVGCGTGTLAIAASARVGSTGRVAGIDASLPMLEHARHKAQRRGLEIEFELGSAETLPWPEASFDVVLSSTVLHCLSDQSRSLALRAMSRVLKTSGRMLLVDYGGNSEERHSLLAHMKAHQRFRLGSVIPALLEAGLEVYDEGSVGFADLHFLLLMPSVTVVGGRAVDVRFHGA